MPELVIQGKTVPFHAALFDKDGTLLDFMALWGQWAEVLTRLVESHLSLLGGKLLGEPSKLLGLSFGLDGRAADYDRRGPLAMASEEQTIAVLAWQLYAAAGMAWNEALLQVRQFAKSAMQTVREEKNAVPMPGLLSLLQTCKRLGIPLGVVTADRTSEAADHLAWLGISAFFSTVVGHDRVSLGKPDPQMLELACSELGVAPGQVLMIGDTDGDMQMGRQGGAALSVGYAPDGDSGHLIHADFIIHHYADLEAAIRT
ncbi:haloacid dehalogenase [Paenibacillus sp. CAA11]|uniref:HAD family hydrolase n=1 Tax=Paenibacillus sp. CAA11 TaxID=1532905 RepID=UPI000D35D4FA|nr:HAD family hydrolase [Paenibacillus sp. CAA11]AWB45657.1 haloacid dehalogenase [Paenibacillus sp. CAA11]